jgi:chemotaxis protein methyltransferase CheR
VRDRDGRLDGAFGYSAEILGFSESAFVLLRDIIAQRVGIYFDEAKRDLLADKLSDLMAARGMTSFLDYYYLLRYDADADRHWMELIDRLSVPETWVWRQVEQLEALVNVVAPRHLAEHPQRPLRIWSAAACTGEEPIGIAIALAEAGLLDRMSIEIQASDASPAMIERARRGVFGKRAMRNLPDAIRDRWFRCEGNAWRVDPRLHARIQWSVVNLIDADAVARRAVADVIFCRNVFIYFADDTILRVVRSFSRAMPDDGHLFLGASESLTRLGTEFELAEIGKAFAYVKAGATRPSTVPPVVVPTPQAR